MADIALETSVAVLAERTKKLEDECNTLKGEFRSFIRVAVGLGFLVVTLLGLWGFVYSSLDDRIVKAIDSELGESVRSDIIDAHEKAEAWLNAADLRYGTVGANGEILHAGSGGWTAKDKGKASGEYEIAFVRPIGEKPVMLCTSYDDSNNNVAVHEFESPNSVTIHVRQLGEANEPENKPFSFLLLSPASKATESGGADE